ncbi:hypothetical protein Tco_0519510 [Tanacetum coccineum]
MSMLEDRSSYINVSESAQDTDVVNPTHAYYNGSRTSQDKEDPSWSTSIKTRRQRRHLQHWKRLGCHFILLYLYLIGTFRANGEDAVEHIKYFLRIVDPIDLPNVNQDKLRVVVFPILLVGDAWRWIETNLFDYETPLCEKIKEFNYLLKIDPDFLTNDIMGFNTYEEYKDNWIYEWNKDVPWVHENPWTDDGEWKEPTPRDDGYCNGGNLPEAYIVGNTLRYQDLEWYDALKDIKVKEEALKNKAIMEGMIDEDAKSSNEGGRGWDDFNNTNRDNKSKNEMEHEERCEVFNDHERLVYNIRRFEMIKYSFRDDEEYVAVKEDKYDDLTSTSKDACRAY